MTAAAFLASFAVSFICLRLLLSRLGQFALDRPNDRSLHARPVPRTGGLAVVAGVLVSIALGGASLGVLLALAAVLAAVSFIDDLRPMPSLLRFAIHLCAAAVLVWYVMSPMHPAEMVLLVLAIAWVTNLYNFMDGSDGLAAGMAIIGFGTYAIVAWLDGDAALASVCAAIVAASAAFLIHNFHPARIFLGDVGSIPLGFLAAALGILGWRNDHWPLWFPVLVFGPFIGDATLTLAKRLARGERVWQAHREHYYQRLVRMGFGHRGTAAIEYGAMLACAAAAMVGRGQRPGLQAASFAAGSLILAALAIWVDVRWGRYQREQGTSA